MAKKRRNGVLGWVAFGATAAVGAGIAAERFLVKRDRTRPDAFANEPYGSVHGESVGPVAAFDGTLLHVEEAGTGPTVILVHGFSLNTLVWHHQWRDLTHDHRLVAFDQRGHGRSGRATSEDYSLDALARDIDAVIREHGGDGPVVLVGHSMGGMAALTYCGLFPEQIGTKVAGLVLTDTTAADVIDGVAPGVGRWLGASTQGVQEVVLRLLASRTHHIDKMRTRGGDLAYVGTRLMGFGRDPSPRQVDFLDEILSSCPSDVWLKAIPAMLALDVTSLLPAIDVPTLVMVGSHDRLTPAGAAERLAGAIAGAELVVFPGAGHTPMLEVPNQFNVRLREFVARAASRVP